MMACSLDSRMKAFVLTAVLGIALTISSPASDDDAAISDNASSDQVSAALDHLVNKALDQQTGDDNFNPDRLVDSKKPDDVAGKLEGVSAKVLLDVLNQTPQYPKSGEINFKLILKRQALAKALINKATDADLPDILNGSAVEALWVVCARPYWQSNPAVTSFLGTQLDQIPSESPDKLPEWISRIDFYSDMYNGKTPCSPVRTWQWTVLDLASLDENAAVQKQLVQTIQRGLDQTGTPGFFFADAFEVAARSNNPAVLKLTPDLMNRIVSFGEGAIARVLNSVFNLVNAHPELAQDPAFASAATRFIKTHPGGYAPIHTDLVMLARLGDSASFGDAIEIYFDKDAFKNAEGGEEVFRRSFNAVFEPKLLESIVYHGSGDRLEGIKAYSHTAVFKDGHWIVTAPDYTPIAHAAPPTEPASPPPPTPVASVPNVAAPTVTPAPKPSSPPPLPSRVAVKARVPIETLDGTGQVTAASMAKVGDTYKVVRADGKFLIVQDATGIQYRISGEATSPFDN